MTSAEGKRFVYEKNQLIEVICQLRFPTILSIDAKAPADFQDQVREAFPKYSCQIEKQPVPGGKPQDVHNHTFISADGKHKLSLTKNFIALSSMRYGGWEEFAGTLDEPLGQLIKIYRPAYFERVGLRYVNGISREVLGLTGHPWNDLFQPAYLGILDNDDVDEKTVVKCSVDVEQRLTEANGKIPGVGLKLHCGPGTIQRSVRTPEGKTQVLQERAPRFIFDQDLYSAGQVQLQDVMEVLENLHKYADSVFSDAITDTLHDAMEAVEL